MDPAQILGLLAGRDQDHDRRQYGIVDLVSRTADHTGNSVPSFSGERSGRVGDVVWQVQGNLLAGPGVLDAIETALGATHLDLPTRLMAAMEAAHAAGGDGRCSCDVSRPTSCGFAAEQLHEELALRVPHRGATGRSGRHLQRERLCERPVLHLPRRPRTSLPRRRTPFCNCAPASMPGPPRARAASITSSRRWLSRTSACPRMARARPGSASSCGTASAHRSRARTWASRSPWSPPARSRSARRRRSANGVHELRLVAGTQATTARVQRRRDRRQRVHPPRSTARSSALVDDPLWCAQSTLSIQSGGALEFVLRSDDPQPRLFSLLASASGSTPGIPLGPGLVLPLMPDLLLEVTASAWFHGSIPGLYGITPAAGRATSTVSFPPGLWGLPPGLELSWAFAFWHPLDTVSNPVTVRVVM
jgi:hypothetical protein